MIGLEHLRDGSVSDRNFQSLMNLVPDTGGQSIGFRFGTGTLTWPGGSTTTSVLTVPHGLGRKPAVVFALVTTGSPFAVSSLGAVGVTNFTVNARTVDGSSPVLGTTATIHWQVCG